ncbi:MAG: hypothetical protein WCT05_02705, partial [Lentisphaeria bacterium]
MHQLKLPETLVGQWIWLREPDTRQETHLFFRRDFCVSEMPGNSEMWITARTGFHLYINGQLCAIGPTANPSEKSYVYCVDINYLIQVGNNQIAVQLFNANDSLTNSRKKPGGFWAQLQIDGQPFVWTDEDWKCLIPDCYVAPGIIQGIGAPSVEIMDFRHFPQDWQRMEIATFSRGETGKGRERNEKAPPKSLWYRPQVITNVEESKALLEAAPNPDDIVETCTWKKIAFVGGCRQIRQSLWVNFRLLTKQYGAGVYVAETFLHSDTDCQQGVYCFCDLPYRMYLNDVLVSEQAVEPTPVHTASKCRGERRLGLDEYAPLFVQIKLEKGWNRFLWLEDCASHGAGMTMVWQDAPNGSILIRQHPDEHSNEGWSQVGPLKTPLSLTHPMISVEGDAKQDYLMTENPAWDMSVALTAYNFAARKILPET